MHIYTYIHVCVYIYICVAANMYYMCIYMCAYMWCVHICVYINAVYTPVYVYMCIYINTCFVMSSLGKCVSSFIFFIVKIFKMSFSRLFINKYTVISTICSQQRCTTKAQDFLFLSKYLVSTGPPLLPLPDSGNYHYIFNVWGHHLLRLHIAWACLSITGLFHSAWWCPVAYILQVRFHSP